MLDWLAEEEQDENEGASEEERMDLREARLLLLFQYPKKPTIEEIEWAMRTTKNVGLKTTLKNHYNKE